MIESDNRVERQSMGKVQEMIVTIQNCVILLVRRRKLGSALNCDVSNELVGRRYVVSMGSAV